MTPSEHLKLGVKFGLKIVFFILIALLYAGSSFSQHVIGLHFTGFKKRESIPFEVLNNLLIIPVVFNNSSDTLRFILDSGVTNTIITDPKTGEKLGLKYTNKIKIRGAGEGGSLDALVSVGNTLAIGSNIRGEQMNVLVLSEDLFSLPSYLGKEVHGLIGYDIFGSFICDINFKTNILKLSHYPAYKNKKKYTKFPISVERNKPYILAKIVTPEGKILGVKLIVDTGASHSLSLNTDRERGVVPPIKNIPAHLGKGLSGDISGVIARIPEFSLGTFMFRDLITSFPDSASYTDTDIQFDRLRHGNMGAGMLKNFRVVFDYKNGIMALKRRSRWFFDQHSEFNMSGIVLTAKGEELKNFVVSNIYPDSPAERAGIREGDELWAIDLIPAVKFTLNDINLLFSRRPGKKIRLLLRGENGFREAVIKLERAI